MKQEKGLMITFPGGKELQLLPIDSEVYYEYVPMTMSEGTILRIKMNYGTALSVKYIIEPLGKRGQIEVVPMRNVYEKKDECLEYIESRQR